MIDKNVIDLKLLQGNQSWVKRFMNTGLWFGFKCKLSDTMLQTESKHTWNSRVVCVWFYKSTNRDYSVKKLGLMFVFWIDCTSEMTAWIYICF